MRVALPEQIQLDFIPAHFGSRSIAYVCDFLIRWTAILLLGLVLLYVLLGLQGGEGAVDVITKLSHFTASKNLLLAIAIIGIFIIEWSYPILFETLNRGVTPGKYLVGLRVVDESGLPITFRSSFLRSVLLIVDLMPATGLVGLVFMWLSKRRQRLGDLLARTLVVYDIEESALPPAKEEANIPLSPGTYALLEQFVTREGELLAATRDVVAERCLALCQRDNAVLLSSETPASRETPAEQLRALYVAAFPVIHVEQKASAYREAQQWAKDLAALRDTRLALDTLIARRPVSHTELRAAVDIYQRACNTYARWSARFGSLLPTAAAAALIRSTRVAMYGGRLRRQRGASSASFMTRVQNSFAMLSRHCAAATSLSLAAGALTWLAVHIHPEFGWHFINEEVAEDLRAGKLWTEAIRGMGSMAAAGIMTNNITVTFNAFALGITAGVGTVVVLIYNGISLGGTFAALVPYGMSWKLGEFILAHGFLELSVIFVAGGCGLYMGDAIINPGTRTRRRALQEHALVAADVIVYSAVWLILAGLVEGFVSPQESVPWGIKLGVGLLLGGAYWITLIKRSRQS